MLPPTQLGVIIRNTAPRHDSRVDQRRYRRVELTLTDEQREALELYTGECVDGCYLRPAGEPSRDYFYVNDFGENGLGKS